MNNNEGLENIKKQMLDLFSLKKERGRKEFILYSITPLLLFLVFIFFLLDKGYRLLLHLHSAPIIIIPIIIIGVVISVIIASAVCLTIFSLQRLNSLKLNKNISYVFIVTSLIILIQTIAPAIERDARWNNWKAVEAFFEDLSYFLATPTLILSFICIILIILLSLLKVIDK